jgi:hypothetical protein
MTPARSSIIKASQGRRVMFPALGVWGDGDWMVMAWHSPGVPIW